jgi:hypothetical protein
MKDKLKSRKFWIVILSIAGLVATAISGEISVAQAVEKIVYIIMGYFGANGIEHLAINRKE